MARIAGIELPVNKRVEIALTYISMGIGVSISNTLIKRLGIDKNTKLKDLEEKKLNELRSIIEKEYKVEGELRSRVQMDIKRLVDLGCYRGLRHRRKLPVRGQRTKTNAHTSKKRRLVAIGKKIINMAIKASKKGTKKIRTNITMGKLYVKSTFNNTVLTLTDMKGDTLCWASGGMVGF